MSTNTLAEKPIVAVPEPEEWLGLYGDYLYRIAKSKVNDDSIAEDLVQETFLAALKAYSSFNANAAFKTWLVGILKRKIADHYRKQSVNSQRFITTKDSEIDQGTSTDSEFDSKGSWQKIPQLWQLDPNDRKVKKPEELAENAEFWTVLTSCASNMPDHLSRAFSRRIISEEASNEICENEGISKKNLSVRLHRARLLIRRCLEQKWFGSESEEE